MNFQIARNEYVLTNRMIQIVMTNNSNPITIQFLQRQTWIFSLLGESVDCPLVILVLRSVERKSRVYYHVRIILVGGPIYVAPRRPLRRR